MLMVKFPHFDLGNVVSTDEVLELRFQYLEDRFCIHS